MRNFRSFIWIQLIALAAAMLLLGAMIWHWHLIAAPILLGLIILVQIIGLNKYLTRTQQNLNQFFSQVAYDDFTQEVPRSDQSKVASELQDSMQEVVAQFQAIRLEKEEGFRYLEQVIQHLSVPTLALEGTQIRYMNAAARQLLNKGFIREARELPPTIQELLQTLLPGQKQNIRWQYRGESLQLLATLSEFKLQTQVHRLLSLQDIRAEIDQTELKAWHKLTRVLHHEIMNSVTPMLTLTEAVEHQLFGEGGNYLGETLNPTEKSDLKEALRLLHQRSEGLQHFVSDYKAATQLPLPKRSSLSVKSFLDDNAQLLRSHANRLDIEVSADCTPDDMVVQADRELLEQVLINLMLNAIQAMESKQAGLLHLEAHRNVMGEAEIVVQDNGPGIDPGQIEEIFVPFFTTKPEGSGLGLAIARQILQAHGGSLTVRSTVGEGTAFMMRLPA